MTDRRLVPNFAVMTHAEIFAYSRANHELSGVAKHIFELEAGLQRVIEAEFLVRDLVTAQNADQVSAIRERAKAYVNRVFGGSM